MAPRTAAASGDDNADLIAPLPPALAALAVRGTARAYRKGTLLIEEGSQGDTLYLLLAGRVKAFSSDARGREIVYGIYGAGEYFGEMSLDGGPRSASVITLEATRCVVLTRKSLADHIAAAPEFAFELIARVIGRARLATASARSMALLDAYGRLAQLLNGLARPRADGTLAIEGRLTHAEIGARIGCSREMVSRLLKDLARGGYVRAETGAGLVLPRPLPPHW
jgi:CRP/FNR family transcriptional regulator, cyclic AMP receptor protein